MGSLLKRSIFQLIILTQITKVY